MSTHRKPSKNRRARSGVLAPGGRRPVALFFLTLIAVLASGRAGAIALDASDVEGETSFNTNLNWDDGQAPSAGNDYETAGFVLRTPAGSDGEIFAGESLTVNDDGALYMAASTGFGVVRVDDLRLDDGTISYQSATGRQRLRGVVTMASGGGSFDAGGTGKTLFIDSRITGAGEINIISSTAPTGAAGTVVFTSGSNDYTGNVNIDAGVVLGQTNANALSSNGDGIVVADGVLNINGLDAAINGLAGTGSVVSGSGSPTFTLDGASGQQAFSGVISGGLDLVKTGGSGQTLSGANTYTGLTSVEGGTLTIQNDTALGTVAGETEVAGSGRVALQGGIAVAEVFRLYGRGDGGVHLENVADANSISSAVRLEDSTTGDSSETFSIESANGSLNIAEAQSFVESGDAATLRLGGDSTSGVNIIGALTLTSGSENNLTKTGASEWSIDSAQISDGTISTQGGVLSLTGAAALTGSMVFEISDSAELDVTGLTDGTLNVADTQKLKGDGLVDGNIVAASGSELTAGDFGQVGELAVNGLLDLDGTLQVDIGNGIDTLIVADNLDLESAILDLNVLSSGTAGYMVLAKYGSLTGVFDEGLITITSGFEYDIVYNDALKQIEINVTATAAAPLPAPLALIATGLLILSWRRNARRR